MMKKLTIQNAQKLAEKKKGKCLSTEYTNNNTKMMWKCNKCKHQWKATYGNVQQGRWCPECIKNTLQDAQKLAEKHKGNCLSIKYINARTKMLWRCEKEHQWEATYNNVQQGGWCLKCDIESKKNTLQNAQRLAEKHRGSCLSKEYINAHTKMLWGCEEEHQWEATYNDVEQNHWCSECGGTKKKTLQNAQELAAKHKGKCLSVKYINNHTKMLWKCEEEHQWEAIYNNIQRNQWCPYCGISKSQKKLAKILQELMKENPITIRPYWLKNPETNYPLEIDIYFPKHKIAVEYNGKQHYQPVDFAGRGKEWADQSLKDIQARDKIKQELIEQNPDKVKHFIIFTHRSIIEKENVKNILIKRGIINQQKEVTK